MAVSKMSRILLILLFISLAILCGACQRFRAQPPEERPYLPGLESVVVVGFRSAMSEWDEPRAVRSPITGAVFSAAPVSTGVVNKMTAKLFEGVQKEGPHRLISPGQTRGALSSLISSDIERTEIEILQHVGQTFSADAVLIGYLYRWRERVGSDLAAERPASVAFELSLLRPEDGGILWRGKFDKTQQSLSENLLEWNTFVKGQARWMTAEKLAEMGLEDLLSRMPIGQNEEKD